MTKSIEIITANSKGMKTVANSKGHMVTIDEPELLGGTDEGANPLGVYLASLAGCENAVANMVAEEIDFDLQGIQFEISGRIDTRGMMGDKEVRTYFQEIKLTARVQTSESDERIKELQEIVDSRCPVFTTMKAADVDMISHWIKDEL